MKIRIIDANRIELQPDYGEADKALLGMWRDMEPKFGAIKMTDDQDYSKRTIASLEITIFPRQPK